MNAAVLIGGLLLAAVLATAGVAKLVDLEGSRGRSPRSGYRRGLPGRSARCSRQPSWARPRCWPWGRCRAPGLGRRTVGTGSARRLLRGDRGEPRPRPGSGLPLLRPTPLSPRGPGDAGPQRCPAHPGGVRGQRRRGATDRGRRGDGAGAVRCRDPPFPNPSDGARSVAQCGGPRPGGGAPGFQLPNLAGRLHTLDSLRAGGRPVLLLFSDPGCGPCTKLAPEVARWQRDHADELTVAVIEHPP